ncbi:MurR/RpiR family transcriptional regulator [Trujillonella humicola]|uniref:MurR/RpiR family transcriptional regulator n=1 Tax=Trujillonella humicola TaxID=3383699 RepID=UPI00390679EA
MSVESVEAGAAASPPPGGTANLLDRISDRLPELRRSEQKVAAAVLADPARVVREGLADLARRAGVSEPTVVRFARALGFGGFQDFKIQAAQSVALGIPVTQSSIDEGDDVATTVEKIFNYSVTSLAHARSRLDTARVQAAAALMSGAREIIFIGSGASSIVAGDAVQKAALFGVPCSAPVDPQMQFLAVALATPETVLVAISNTGRTAAVVDAARSARARGVATIAITGELGPLSEVVDVPILVETFENTDFYTPTTSRLAHLTVIDVLATVVAMNRPDGEKTLIREAKARLAVARSVPSLAAGEGGDARGGRDRSTHDPSATTSPVADESVIG